jgi:hypothetical protein
MTHASANPYLLACVLALVLPALGCSPSIDASDVQSFERSLTAAKTSLSTTEQTKLENAIFALTMQGAVLHLSDDGWEINPNDNSSFLDSHSFVVYRGGLSAYPDNFVEKFVSLHVRKITAIVNEALEKNLNTEDPIPGVVEQLVTPERARLQQLFAKEREGEMVEVHCYEINEYNSPLGSKAFAIKNESKWPIYRIESRGAQYDFRTDLEPGQWSESIVVLSSGGGALPPRQSCVFSASELKVYVRGRDPFVPTSSPELKKARLAADYLTKISPDVKNSLQQIIDWLRLGKCDICPNYMEYRRFVP